MVSNKNRKTKYQPLQIHESAMKEFSSCQNEGETKTDTLLKIIRIYKSKEALA